MLRKSYICVPTNSNGLSGGGGGALGLLAATLAKNTVNQMWCRQQQPHNSKTCHAAFLAMEAMHRAKKLMHAMVQCGGEGCVSVQVGEHGINFGPHLICHSLVKSSIDCFSPQLHRGSWMAGHMHSWGGAQAQGLSPTPPRNHRGHGG